MQLGNSGSGAAFRVHVPVGKYHAINGDHRRLWGIGCEVAKPCVENDARVFGGARRQEDAKRVGAELSVSHVLTLRGFRQWARLRRRPLRHDQARLAARPRPGEVLAPGEVEEAT